MVIVTTNGAWAEGVDLAAYEIAIQQARQGIYDPALSLVRTLDDGHPGSQRFVQDHIRIAAWAGHAKEAADACDRLYATAWPADILGDCARAHRETGDWETALALYREGMARFPERTAFSVGEAMTLSAMGMPQVALLLAEDHSGAIDPATQRRLQADRLAQLARLASAEGRGEKDRYRIADLALAGYDALIARWSAQGPQTHADVLRLRLDRLQVLAARHRSEALIAEYEALRAAGIHVPPYALQFVADAYLDMRRPDQALRVLDAAQVAEAEPEQAAFSLEPTIRIYALSESGQPGQAEAHARQTLADMPIWIQLKGQPRQQPNDERLATELAAVSALHDTENEAAARARLEALQARAPGDTALGVALAELYRSQGEPRRAEWLLKRVETLEPRAPALEAVQARVALDLQEWAQARELGDDLQARFPGEQYSRLAARDWNVHQMAELQIHADTDLSSNTGPNGGHGLQIEALQYSPPLNNNWRAFAAGGHAQSSFEEGRGEHQWLRAGAQSRSRGLTLDLEGSIHRYGDGTRYGGALHTTVDINDYWQLGAGLERLSMETPLRALHHGIYANRAAVHVEWRDRHDKSWRLAASGMNFSDGNRRWRLAIDGRQRILVTTRWEAVLGLGLAASTNSAEDAPYFNPRKDLEILPSLQFTHTLYQHYEERLQQSFLVAAGVYAQQGYGPAAIALAEYGLHWQASATFQTGVRASVGSRPYDGERETDFRILLDLVLRF